MRIGIIGTGHVGSVLASKWVGVGHHVALANAHGPQTLTELADRLGHRARAATVPEAARYGEVAVLAIPFGRYRELPATELAGQVVVDCTNYYPQRDGQFAELDSDRTTSTELVASHLNGARVVKAFNTMSAEHLDDYAHCNGAAMLYGMPVSGDDDEAKRTVMDLVEELCFEPVDAGDLAHGGRKQQPGGETYLTDLSADELRARIGTQF
jgi:8-hydroxy-5-deazaflavin:NADPH oxidoreductase